MRAVLAFAFMCLCQLAKAALASGQGLDYAGLRAQVSHSMPERAQEMAEAVSALQQLSVETSGLLRQLQAQCGSA